MAARPGTRPILKENHQFAGFMLMCEDVTEQRRASELIEYHDLKMEVKGLHDLLLDAIDL